MTYYVSQHEVDRLRDALVRAHEQLSLYENKGAKQVGRAMMTIENVMPELAPDDVKFIQEMVANRQVLKEPPLQIEEEELTIEQRCAKTLPEITLFFCGGCGARAKMCMGDCYPDEVMKPRVAIRYIPVGRADV